MKAREGGMMGREFFSLFFSGFRTVLIDEAVSCNDLISELS